MWRPQLACAGSGRSQIKKKKRADRQNLTKVYHKKGRVKGGSGEQRTNSLAVRTGDKTTFTSAQDTKRKTEMPREKKRKRGTPEKKDWEPKRTESHEYSEKTRTALWALPLFATVSMKPR